MGNKILLRFRRAIAAVLAFSRPSLSALRCHFTAHFFGILIGLFVLFPFGLSAQNVKKDCGKTIMPVGELLSNPQAVVALPFGNTPGLESCNIPNIGGDGMAVDQTKGIVYAGNPFSDSIQVYDFSLGQFKTALNPAGDLRSYDVAISPDGNFLYRGYLNSGGGVQKISVSDGAQVAIKAANRSEVKFGEWLRILRAKFMSQRVTMIFNLRETVTSVPSNPLMPIYQSRQR